MISIIEQKSEKVVGATSLIVLFQYNEQIISILKQTDCAIWNKKKKVWELPCITLAYLIDNLCYLDDIELSLLEDSKEEELNQLVEYKTKPFDYQNDGIKWLINHPNSLLLDEPGLGKTLQIIYTAEELKKQKGIEHCLIICGINTLKTNWEKEIHKHSTLSCKIVGKKINSKGNISYKSNRDKADELFNEIDEFFIILNVEAIRDDLIVDAIINSKNNFDMIAFDELHKVKDATSLQGANLLKLSKVGTYHYGITGTVIVNSPFDAYVPLRFAHKENACMSTFKSFYCIFQKKFDYRLGKERNDLVGYRNLDVLREEIASCSLRRKKDILNLPPKTVIDEYVDMSSEHIKFYNDISNGIVEEADRVEITNKSLLGLTVRMRQAATCPSILTSNKMIETKIERACDLAREIISNGDKVVIFCSFKDPLKKVYEMLKDCDPLVGTGDVDDDIVSENIDKFQTDDSRRVLICTPQKMSAGITLTAASYMILLDAPWTQSDFDQETDRIHRIGSAKPVIIYDLIATGTIDERAKNLREYKKNMANYLVDGEINEISTCSKDDYLYLLGLKKSLN